MQMEYNKVLNGNTKQKVFLWRTLQMQNVKNWIDDYLNGLRQ